MVTSHNLFYGMPNIPNFEHSTLTESVIPVSSGENPIGEPRDRSPATEFAKNFGRYKELPVRGCGDHQPRSHDRLLHVGPEYAEYQRLKARARRVYHICELSEEAIAALASARMNPAHDPLTKPTPRQLNGSASWHYRIEMRPCDFLRVSVAARKRNGASRGTQRSPLCHLAMAGVGSDPVTIAVAPVTHTALRNRDLAVEIPPKVKRHLGLDDGRS